MGLIQIICKIYYYKMFHRVDYKNQPKPKILSKGMSNYDKLQKSMNEPLKDYNQIKDLVELENNSITK